MNPIPIPIAPHATRNPDLTREALLHAAFCEIHRNGFQGAGIAQILTACNLTKGALYHYFPTKHALGLAVIDEVIVPRINALILEPLRASATPVQTLLDITLTIGDQVGEEMILLGCPLNNLMQEMSPLDETFRRRLDTALTQWRATLLQARPKASYARMWTAPLPRCLCCQPGKVALAWRRPCNASPALPAACNNCMPMYAA